MNIGGPEIDRPPRVLAGDLLPRLFQHVRGVVDADELHARIQDGIERQQCGRGRAADVVETGVRLGKILAQLAHHALHFLVMRHGAADHVVEHVGDLGIEGKIPHRLVLLNEDLVPLLCM